MPPKKAVAVPKEPAECILRYGKSNNVIQWAEEMQTATTALYGVTGMFFTTNERYRPPRVTEKAILRAFYESDSEDEDEESVDEDETAGQAAARAAAAAARKREKKAAREA
jgi:hypothetical protein